MGASNARSEDASLGLAVPKHITIGHRRVLDPRTRRCSSCNTSFALFAKKHYCRRCGAIICDQCTTLRTYKARNGPRFRICRKCDLVPVLLSILPQKLWHAMLSFAGNRAHHNALQTCRKLQMAVPLPYPWAPSWDSFFTEGTFLSKGANGSVYKATLKSDPNRRPVAVKVVQKNTIFSLRKWHHIQREIDCLRVCKHKHVVELISVAQSPEAVFIVLEYAQGGDLFDWLVTRRAPSEADVRPLALQLMSTLQYMHDDCNAVHRDIKPENILLEKRIRGQSDTPCIKLGDFGFARVFPGKAPSASSNSGAVPIAMSGVHAPPAGAEMFIQATPCGTLGFAPPEVLKAFNEAKSKQTAPASKRGSKAVDESAVVEKTANSPVVTLESMKKTDIFAAGVTLCILLTGAEPFPCHSSKALMDAVNRGLTFGRQWDHVSKEARNILTAMLRPKEADRPSAAEVLRSPWLSSLVSSKPMEVAKKEDASDELFARSLKSLRKHENVMYKTDAKTGEIQIAPREEPEPIESVPNPILSEELFSPVPTPAVSTRTITSSQQLMMMSPSSSFTTTHVNNKSRPKNGSQRVMSENAVDADDIWVE